MGKEGVKILAVSDTVSDELLASSAVDQRLQGIELILSCGDLPPEYLRSLRHRFDVPLLYVQGNHDLRYDAVPPHGCTDIDRRIVTVGDVAILGFSGSRWYNGGVNQYTEKQMKSSIRRLRFSLWRRRPEIVVTHAPPRHVHDAEDPCHKGFRCYGRLIEKYRPAYFIHGHIHKLFKEDGQRVTRIHSTRVINSYGFHVFQT